MKSGPSAARCCDTRVMLAVASFTPVMFLSSYKRFMVSTEMSMTEREGMLYMMIGIPIASLIALKCW